jgi:hypothetical protein
MSDRAAGAASGKGGTRWGAVALGWVLAVIAGIVAGTILRQAYGLLADPPVEGGELTATVMVISVVSGFLSYLVGGYAAARMAGYSGGRHGALTAVFGLILGVILTVVLVFFGTVFTEGLAAAAVPPSSFGPIGAAWTAGTLILFLVNLFAGFVGGKLGEPSHTQT